MASVIVLDGADDFDSSFEPSPNRQRRFSSVSSSETLQAIEIEDCPDDIFLTGEIIDLTDDVPSDSRDHLRPGEAPLEHAWAASGLFIKRGDFLEVKNAHLGKHPINFIKVELLLRDKHGEPQIRGTAFTRTRNLEGRLKKSLNEVCMVVTSERRDGSETDRVLLYDVSPYAVVKKRTLIVTNTRYPAHAVDVNEYRTAGTMSKSDAHRKASSFGNIVCRWQLFFHYTIRDGRKRPDEEVIQHIREESVLEDKYRVADEAIRHHYSSHSLKSSQTYTVFDSFCGAGGVSRGALHAGFHIKYAIDKSPEV
jgi:DNA (cytosine-5)-methyltransferase 1